MFAAFARSTAVTDLVAELVGPDVDCFLSQFIFKNPGAWGQPWHQDSYYFPFEPAAADRRASGSRSPRRRSRTAACTSCPARTASRSTSTSPIARPGANYGYVEIVDHDMGGAVPVLMEPGDLLVFDSHLMHRSTDNTSNGIRAAMVFHYAAGGTRIVGGASPVIDFETVRRRSRGVAPEREEDEIVLDFYNVRPQPGA